MKKVILFSVCLILGYSCENILTEPVTLITGEPESITTNSVTVSIEANNINAVNRMGIVYSKTSEFEPSNEAVSLNISKNEKVTISGLESGVMYYYKAFASDRNDNIVYGNTATFTTEKMSRVYSVAFKYTHHMYGGDRFYDDVKIINLFVFDENNLFYTKMAEISPYERNYNIPLDLPMGKYHIIAWGNVFNNGFLSFTPLFENFQKGVTTLQQARFALQRDVNNVSSYDLEKIFYGETIVEIPSTVNRIDTISLKNNTKNIRVVLHWDHTGAPPLLYGQSYADFYNEIDVNLLGHNAVYYFDDTPAPNDVFYAPYAIDRTGEILRSSVWDNAMRIFYYSDIIEADMDSIVFDFKVLRLIPSNPLIMTVMQHSVGETINLLAPIGSPELKDPTFGIDIVGSFTDSNGFSKYQRDILNVLDAPTLQSNFDKYDNYRVDVYLKYKK